MLDTDNEILEFTANDRCDRCGAQAYSLAIHPDAASELMFCVHHRRQHTTALYSKGWKIIDDAERLGAMFEAEGVTV